MPNAVPTLPVFLRAEHHVDPLAVTSDRPRLSWRLNATDATGRVRRGARQAAYRIQGGGTSGETTWDSGWVESAQAGDVVWGGPPLGAFAALSWRVRVRDETGAESPWSASARLGRGPVAAADWGAARWIGSPLHFTNYVPLLRRAFRTVRPTVEARLFVTARGVADFWIDGS